MKKLFIMLLLNIMYISAFADTINITKHLFFTLEGSIDKYPITINIHIENPDNITENKKSYIDGYYKYNNVNTPIPINGEMDKNTIKFTAFDYDNSNKKEEFSFKINSSQLNNIINLGNSKKNINLKGSWKNNNKKLSCNIDTVKPLGDKIHTVYDISVSKEYKDNTYGLSALYIENLKSSIYEGEIINKINNTNEMIKKINDDIAKVNLNEEEIFHEVNFYNFYNKFFNDNILCFTSSTEYYYGGAYPDTAISHLTLDINKLETKILTLSDFVNDSDKFRKTLQSEIDKHYKEIGEDDFTIDVINKSDSFYAETLMSRNVAINRYSDGISLHIRFELPHVVRALDDFEISFEKLKPYLKKNIY
ncbi:hypothetical protein PQQ32_03805 [Brachyspira hyodysenteriae]|uniref:hypothetical protein n=1 Tax=Brachyspira hyodysenteriae TaxID=159 RepID=UPI00063DB4E2|nr:hypothetical protein [Brachyspira hyodysenteriae]KLI17083.1 hypothetical protein SU46_09130 [Brachyspira hyodysenteriae]KLI35754.1 hypothetical protein SZ48_01415 [Brachyspira hyodysenteriae]KLI36682.1 hypothetical protein SZ51_12000 [Brachyspira hyodysenteriae]KLI40127.1 hypothetical protein SZ52_11425 [Brachyspira hyodysenteriae]KLI52848.1 hypothetical protein SZ42_02970 [Brachyspira hyodysenteriae]